MLNIPSYIDDPSYRYFILLYQAIYSFYRYKMPSLLLKIEGKGNGIKTNIVNLSEVAKALRVPTNCIYLLF